MSELTDFRAEKDELFRDDYQSPLTHDQQADFAGLNYFPENAALAITATLEPFPAFEPVEMITSKGSIQSFNRVGRLHFSVDGVEQALTLFQDDGGQYLFLPYTDTTSGNETYDAGRYVEVESAGMDGEVQLVLVDFNRAYNPYCAYNEDWVCPIPPAENRLSVPIRAGEKKFH